MAHDGPGEVIIIPGIKGCDCQYHCAALNAKRSLVQCVCPPGERVNGNTCKPESQDIADYVLVGLVTLVVVLFILLSAIAFYTYNKFQKRKELQLRRKTPSGADLQLRNLRNDLMTETNPNYEFAGERYTLKDLRDVPREHLRLTRALGQGAFGEVYEGLYKMRPGDAVEMPVAVKTLPELSTLQAENDFMLEALIMGKFNHPNIVHLIGVCFDKHPRYIVLELLSGGDLKTFLRESRPRNDRPSALNMKDLLMCCVDVAKGCKYLEENRFIHRDIAARNCLLTAKTPGRIVKIADFGMAREVYMSDYYRKGGKAMLPIKWMPPEAFLDGIFTTKTDVWSYGVLLWEVMSLGYMPYTGCANRNVMSLVVSGGRLEPPPNCPSLVYAIMTSCWHPEPPQRPDFATILEKLAGCLQDPETLATPLKPMIGLTESGLQIRYNRDFEAISKSLALAHGWLFDGKDADVLTSPPALSVAPSASTELSNLSSPVDQEAVERMERSPTADYLVPTMPLGIALTPSHVALPSAPPVPHRPPLGPAPGGGEGWLPGTTPTRSHSKQPLLQGDSRDSRDSRDSPGSSLGGSLAQLANGKAVSPNPLPLDPALLVRPNPKLRTEADGAPSPIADAEITC
ncbi:ALK tyrosine kinase receptor isoform X1 [Frankliniella occidentalis]|uniref:receptor protein-tyrosine kinase n=1 Tax=Frankliniella occidentalis TaxID=133901 RepID=A0A9C6TSW3_FRAOC|nr:ALK tyrosine kinase receptor isoform X1 [Frankliniella occidentalis]